MVETSSLGKSKWLIALSLALFYIQLLDAISIILKVDSFQLFWKRIYDCDFLSLRPEMEGVQNQSSSKFLGGGAQKPVSSPTSGIRRGRWGYFMSRSYNVRYERLVAVKSFGNAWASLVVIYYLICTWRAIEIWAKRTTFVTLKYRIRSWFRVRRRIQIMLLRGNGV